MSSASTSRMALLYSTRFRRCTAGRPGLGLAAAARSRASSRDLVNDAAVGAAGRGMPAGGISPVRILRSTFSSTAALPPALATSIPLSATPAVAFFWLWHRAQYRSEEHTSELQSLRH